MNRQNEPGFLMNRKNEPWCSLNFLPLCAGWPINQELATHLPSSSRAGLNCNHLFIKEPFSIDWLKIIYVFFNVYDVLYQRDCSIFHPNDTLFFELFLCSFFGHSIVLLFSKTRFSGCPRSKADAYRKQKLLHQKTRCLFFPSSTNSYTYSAHISKAV